RVWVVDPLDGTREFVAGIPEWCVSIGLVENGEAIAGGICNPATGETFIGSLESGLTYNGRRARCSQKSSLSGAIILASRSEVKRGVGAIPEWSVRAKTDGIGRLQTRTGGCGTCRRDMDALPKTRMGYRSGCCPSQGRWRCRAQIGPDCS